MLEPAGCWDESTRSRPRDTVRRSSILIVRRSLWNSLWPSEKFVGLPSKKELRFPSLGPWRFTRTGIRARRTISLCSSEAKHKIGSSRSSRNAASKTLHRSSGYSNHLHADPALGRIDVVYVDDDTRGKIFAEARAASLAGMSLVVPKPEHLAAMKIHAMKNDPSRVSKEMADIQFLIGLPGVNRDQVRKYFETS